MASYTPNKLTITKDGNSYTLELSTLEVDCGTISSSEGSTFTKTVANSGITSDMVVFDYDVGTPSAMPEDWSYVTADGSITISGTIFTPTTLTVYLVQKRN